MFARGAMISLLTLVGGVANYLSTLVILSFFGGGELQLYYVVVGGPQFCAIIILSSLSYHLLPQLIGNRFKAASLRELLHVKENKITFILFALSCLIYFSIVLFTRLDELGISIAYSLALSSVAFLLTFLGLFQSYYFVHAMGAENYIRANLINTLPMVVGLIGILLVSNYTDSIVLQLLLFQMLAVVFAIHFLKINTKRKNNESVSDPSKEIIQIKKIIHVKPIYLIGPAIFSYMGIIDPLLSIYTTTEVFNASSLAWRLVVAVGGFIVVGFSYTIGPAYKKIFSTSTTSENKEFISLLAFESLLVLLVGAIIAALNSEDMVWLVFSLFIDTKEVYIPIIWQLYFIASAFMLTFVFVSRQRLMLEDAQMWLLKSSLLWLAIYLLTTVGSIIMGYLYFQAIGSLSAWAIVVFYSFFWGQKVSSYLRLFKGSIVVYSLVTCIFYILCYQLFYDAQYSLIFLGFGITAWLILAATFSIKFKEWHLTKNAN